jgi:hypothetical protein
MRIQAYELQRSTSEATGSLGAFTPKAADQALSHDMFPWIIFIRKT